MRARLLRALFGLCAAFAVIAIVGNVSWELGKVFSGEQGATSDLSSQTSSQSDAPVGSFSIAGQDVQAVADAQEFLKGVGQGGAFEGFDAAVARGGESSLPQRFASEAFGPEGFLQVMTSSDGAVLGFVSPKAASEVFLRCSKQLQAKGWQQVPTGLANQASFVKEEGRYRWMFASCVDVEGGSTLVIVLDGAIADGDEE